MYNIIYCDIRHLSYSKKGIGCVVKTNSQEVFKKYTAFFAISVDGVLGYTLYEKGGIYSERLVEFLDIYILLLINTKKQTHYFR